MSTEDELRLALGDVREGLAAIRNLLELLRSRRVGGPALGEVVQETRRGALALPGTIASLERAVLEPLAGDGALAAAIGHFFAAQILGISTLSADLAAFDGLALDARRRLALERAVQPVATEMDAAICVVDLLGALASPRTTSLDLVDLLRQRWASPRGAAMPRRLGPVRVLIDLGETLPFSGDARVVGALVELVTGLVVGSGAGVRFTLARELEKASVRIVVADGIGEGAPPARGGPELEAPRHVVPGDLVEILARRAGADLALALAERRAVLRLEVSGITAAT